MAVYAQTNDNETPELAPYIVTATRYPEEQQKLAAFVTVLTQEDLKNTGVRTVNEALMTLGGVMGRKSLYGGNEFTIDLGGFGDTANSNMAIVIDGVIFKNGDDSEIRLSNISMDEVERIEIQRGSSSVLYGEGAVGGVINIITRASSLYSTVRNKANIEAGFGSYASREIRANATYGKDGVNLFASSAKAETDGFRANSNSYSNSNNLGMQFIGESARIGASFSNGNEYAKTPGALTLSQYQANRNQANATNLALGTYIDAASTSVGVFAETDVNGFQWRTDVKRRERGYYFLDQSGGSASSAKHATVNDIYGVSTNKNWSTVWGNNRLLLGLEKSTWDQRRITSGFGNYTNSAGSYAIFLKNDLETESTGSRLTVGYRAEKLDKKSIDEDTSSNLYLNDDAQSAWEIGFLKKINQNNSVWVKAGSQYRMANLDEQSYEVISPYRPVALNTQTSVDKEIGWRVKVPSTQLESRIFSSDFKNEIVYDPTIGNINLDPTNRRGVDASIQQLVSRTINLQANVGYMQASFQSGTYKGNTIPLVPSQKAQLRVNWNFLPEQTISLSSTFLSEQFFAGNFSNTYKIPSYTVTDIFYQYKSPDWEFQLIVKNAFDKDYYSYATMVWNGTTGLYPDMKRSIFAVYKYYLN
jgi:iron complex outermembrane receptor protein